ncbi:MAG: hypothetical protein R2909_17725 [Gemmatimonadales bacterium]
MARSPIACSGDMYCGVPRAQARLGHPLAAGGLDREGDPEVGHRGVAVLEQDVLGLDVAVDHPETVRVAEGVGDLAGDENGILDRELLLAVEAGRGGSRRSPAAS